MPEVWTLSLHSRHAERIYAGVKHYEFRRVHASIRRGDTVLIYESGGVGKITGQFEVGAYCHGTPGVAHLEWDETSRADAEAYLAGATRATAIAVKNVRRYETPVELREVGLDRAPQSYCRAYVNASSQEDSPA